MIGRSLLRPRPAPARVTNIELFFDLVFAFAITQLSHKLLHNLTPLGGAETALLFLAVWWVWIYTSWVTNWLEPDLWPVRLALLALMLAGLFLSTSLPDAFDAKGVAFATAYVAMQVGRSLFMIWALGQANPRNTRNFQRITLWLSVSGIIWLVGAFAAPDTRLIFWLVAILIESLGPWLGFAVPGLGRSTTADWDVDGRHLAERCSLFVIIALGEALLTTGASFGARPLSATAMGAFVSAFLGSVALWWIYFDSGFERASAAIAASTDPGRLARLLYTYVHALIVAGIILVAVANDLLIGAPDRGLDPPRLVATLAGPILFLAGNLLFKGLQRATWPLSHLVGLALLCGLADVATDDPTLTRLDVNLAATLILCLTAGWEAWSLRRTTREMF
jgi:low temperature requirement protein LtrA